MPEHFSTEIASRIIGLIYDCAIDPNHWQSTLEAIIEVTRSANAQVSINNPVDGSMLLTCTSGVPGEWLQRQAAYAADFAELYAPAMRDGAIRLNEPFISTRLITAERLASNRYVTEWCAPQNLCDSIGLMVLSEPTRVASMGLGRHGDAGFFTDCELEIVKTLAPHLRRAIIISNLLEVTAIAASRFESALDLLNVGVLLVDVNARVMHSNRCAKALLENGAIRLDNGILRAAHAKSNADLARAISAAAKSEATIGSSGQDVAVLGIEAGPPYVAQVLPLPGANPRRAWMKGSTAAVFIAPGTRSAIPRDALISLYDLTAAETRVLELLVAGTTAAEISSKLSVSEATVRTHIARLLSKTGTSRQSDLIDRVVSLSNPIMAEK